MKQQKYGFKYHTIILKSIAALALGAAMLFSGCKKNELEKIKPISPMENLPIQEADNFENIYTDSGQVRFTLQAPKLLRFDNNGQDYLEFPEGLRLVNYDNKLNVVSSLDADYAKQYVKEKKWEAKNNVILTNAQGDSLKTEHLFWDEKTEKIYTEEFVRIIRQDQIIMGDGLVSDQDMVNWEIKNPKGTTYISVNQPDNGTVPDNRPAPPIEKASEIPEQNSNKVLQPNE